MSKENLYLCMGSACHQMGVYEVLPAIQRLLAEYQVDDRIEFKGSFCLECCSHGIVMKFRDTLFLHINPENVEEKFKQEILPEIQKAIGSTV